MAIKRARSTSPELARKVSRTVDEERKAGEAIESEDSDESDGVNICDEEDEDEEWPIRVPMGWQPRKSFMSAGTSSSETRTDELPPLSVSLTSPRGSFAPRSPHEEAAQVLLSLCGPPNHTTSPLRPYGSPTIPTRSSSPPLSRSTSPTHTKVFGPSPRQPPFQQYSPPSSPSTKSMTVLNNARYKRTKAILTEAFGYEPMITPAPVRREKPQETIQDQQLDSTAPTEETDVSSGSPSQHRPCDPPPASTRGNRLDTSLPDQQTPSTANLICRSPIFTLYEDQALEKTPDQPPPPPRLKKLLPRPKSRCLTIDISAANQRVVLPEQERVDSAFPPTKICTDSSLGSPLQSTPRFGKSGLTIDTNSAKQRIVSSEQEFLDAKFLPAERSPKPALGPSQQSPAKSPQDFSNGFTGGGSSQPQQPSGGLFGSAAPASQPAQSGGLFGAAPQPQQSGGLFGAQQTASPQTTQKPNLFGSTPQPAASTGGLFGTTPAAAPSGGLFGSTPAAPAQPATGGLFGAAPAASKPGGLFGSTPAAQPATGGLFGGAQPSAAPVTGGLFGNMAAPASSAPPAGNLFGASLGTSRPALGGGLFGGANPSNLSAQPTQPGLNFSTTQPQAPLGGLFGSTLGQQPQQQQAGSIPAVKIDWSNVKPTTRFSELHDEVKQTIVFIDDLIQAAMRASVQCSETLPMLGQQIESLPSDVEYLDQRLETVEGALSRDAMAVGQNKVVIEKDVEDSVRLFRAVENLKLPSQFHYSTIGGSSNFAGSDVQSDVAATDLLSYFTDLTAVLEEREKLFEKGQKEVEAHLRTVEFSAVEGLGKLQRRGGEGEKVVGEGLREVAGVMRTFEGAILRVAERVGEGRERVVDLGLGGGGAR